MNDAVILEAEDKHLASVIWLHGLGADGNDFVPVVPELRLPPELGIRYIFPHAPKRPVSINGGMVMRSWYDIKNPDLSQQRDRKDFDDSAAILTSWIEAELASGIPSQKIILAGFSQGGAVALHCGLNFAKALGGLMILSSYLPFADILEQPEAAGNRKTPVLMMHGESDPVIPVNFARQSCAILKQHDYAVEWHDYPMQHGLCMEEINHISDWLQLRLQDR